VNAILDAAYASAKTGRWEPVQIEGWRGNETEDTTLSFASYDEEHYLVKRETLPSGEKKVILKHKVTGLVTAKDEV
jgi:hypothetical protein